MATVYVRNLNEKTNLTALKDAVREAFEEVGPVSDVLAKKTLRMRGQAFVVFETAADAARAVGLLDGREVFGKAMMLAMAKTPSDQELAATSGPEAVEQRKAQRHKSEDGKRRSMSYVKPGVNKRQKTAHIDTDRPPHNILFIQGLPQDITVPQLTAIYGDAPGFMEARVFGARGVGFIEFREVNEATAALASPVKLESDTDITVTYANK